MKSSNRSQVDSFLVMDIMREASQLELEGKSIIHMEVGQPSSGASVEALNNLQKKMFSDQLGYSVALGLPELREQIAELYKRRYKLNIDPERVVITAGSSAAFTLSFLTFFDSGDQILLGEPGYPSYKNIMKSLNLVPDIALTTFENRFHLTVDLIKASSARGVLVASPSNPTGVALKKAELERLIDMAKQKKMVFISDEIYHGLNFNGKDVSALELNDDAIIINSFSKYFSLTGWRLGWMIAPLDFIRPIEKLSQNLFICASHASQYLGLYSLNSSTNFDSKVIEYKNNRDALMKQLPSLGFSNIVRPDGAFYIYADISKFNTTSDKLAKDILVKTGVAITPGIDFDRSRGHNTVRFSFACSQKEVSQAIERLTDWYLSNNKK